ncbi:kinase-like protein [Aspergillus falconensis]
MSRGTAFEAIGLPTIAEIEAATELISTPDSSAKVVRVNERFAVKMGHGVPLIEAENMRFLATNSKVPVPKVHEAFRDPDTNKTYIIMEYLPGDTLQKLLPSLNQVEKAAISSLVKDAITELRSIPAPDYFGMLNHQPYLDGVFWTEGLDSKISGPFASQGDMNLALVEKLGQTESKEYVRLLRNMIDRTLNGHRNVFTHGDLQPKNIMVEKLGDRDGYPQFRITLLDWESAGWYPEYWDFCNATIACRFKPDWLELVPDILDQYPVEFLMMQVVYSSVFY